MPVQWPVLCYNVNFLFRFGRDFYSKLIAAPRFMRGVVTALSLSLAPSPSHLQSASTSHVLSLSLCVRWISEPAVQSCGMHVNYCSLARRTELATPRLHPLAWRDVVANQFNVIS